jgi:hypothetical protein
MASEMDNKIYISLLQKHFENTNRINFKLRIHEKKYILLVYLWLSNLKNYEENLCHLRQHTPKFNQFSVIENYC